MNSIISDTAEYGCYLFNNEAIPLLSSFFKKIDKNVIGSNSLSNDSNSIDNKKLIEINDSIRFHSIEIIGDELRQHMTSMKKAL
jgi:ketol-acid reductoisomerase